MQPDITSQRAPSSINPFIMAPSLGATLRNRKILVITTCVVGIQYDNMHSFCGYSSTNEISPLNFFVTSHCKHILSSGHSILRAVLCIIAVKNDCGLKNPPNHTDEGSYKKNYYCTCGTYSILRVKQTVMIQFRELSFYSLLEIRQPRILIPVIVSVNLRTKLPKVITTGTRTFPTSAALYP